MDVCVWIDRGLDIKVIKRMAVGSTVAMLKDHLASDSLLDQCSPKDIVLTAFGGGAALGDSQRLTRRLAELEFGAEEAGVQPGPGPQPGAGPAGGPAAGGDELLVGRWLYSGKYQYSISRCGRGVLQFEERLSSGQTITGTLQPKGDGYEVDLRYPDDVLYGTMRLHLDEKCGVIRSNFRNAIKTEWGANLVARLKTPKVWPQEAQELQWFEVVFEKVLVKRAPHHVGPSWGFLLEGMKVQVSRHRAVDVNGWEWVELAPAELKRVCEDSAPGPLGLGPLLRGPLVPAECSELTADTGEVKLLLEPLACLPFLPAVPEKVCALAQGIVHHGWAHLKQVGVSRSVLKKVREELSRLEPEMSRGQMKGDEFSFRTDHKLFFDTSSERVRGDIPALNGLVDTLQGLVSQLGKLLERSPLRMRISGRCRPMLATYERHGRYLPHVDNGDGDGRVLTLVYYLNPDWSEGQGGHLRLYPETERRAISYGIGFDDDVADVLPVEDSLAMFRADWMVHEVRPTEWKRSALTLWFLGEFSDG